jgi:hypothetical protein
MGYTTTKSLALWFGLAALAVVLFPLVVLCQAQGSSTSGQSSMINVTALGADPSGQRDSTAAFVQALATGKMVYVPTGRYKITNHDTLVLTHPGQMIFGDGPKDSVLDYTGNCQTDMQGNFAVLILHGSHQLVRSLGITSPPDRKCIMVGLMLASDHGLAQDVAVSQMWHEGVSLGWKYNSLLDSDIEYNRFGVALSGDHLLVRGNYISNHYSISKEPRPWTKASMYWDGIAGEALTNSVIDSNTVEDNGQSGIYTGGNNSVSSGNVITNNTVRHNRNEGIDQGVTGKVVPGSNSLSRLVIANNTSVDNFRRDIWVNEVEQAVVAFNVAEHSAGSQNWWAHDVRVRQDWPVPCQIWAASDKGSVNSVVFVGNTCTQANSAFPALWVNPGAGTDNVIGHNNVQGQRTITPNANRTLNTILPPR